MSETLRDHTLAWLDSIGADGLRTIPDKHGSMLFFEKQEINLALEIEKASELVPAYRHADGTYHTEKEVPKAASVCIHGSGNCLGVKNCMGAFADCLDREKAASQSAELELASIAFNARMNTPDGYAKMIAEFKAFLEVERDAQRQAGREEAMRAIYLLGELMSYDNFDTFPPNLKERVREYMDIMEAKPDAGKGE